MSDVVSKTEEQETEAGSYLAPAGAHKRRMAGEEQSTSLWLITFTDVMALMLTFFVLLYSMSVPEEKDWKEVTKGINSQFTKTYAADWSKGAADEVNIDKVDFSQAQSLSYLKSILANVIEKDERLKNIVLIPQTDHLIISIPQELLFQSGQAEIFPKGRQVLFSLSNTMSRIRNRIEIIGHTDPRPIQQSETFASNWELSLARAGNVASVLARGGYNRPMIIRGLSSSRYDDLPENMTEEDRLSLARRVDIVVMKDDGTSRGESQLDILSGKL